MPENDNQPTNTSSQDTGQVPPDLPSNLPSAPPQQVSPAPGQSAPQSRSGILELLILVAFLLIAFLVLLAFKSSNKGDLSSDIDIIRQQNAALQTELSAERQARGMPALDTENASHIAERIQKDTSLLVQTLTGLEAALAKKEGAVSNTTQALNASQQLNSTLSIQVKNLETQMAQLRLSAQDAPQLKTQLTQTLSQLEIERGKLLEFSRRPSLEELTDVKKALEEELNRSLALRTENAELRQQLETNQSQLATQNPATLKLLRAELEELRPENNDLKRELQRLRAEIDKATLFVDSSDNLSPKAAALYAGLQQLEGLTPDKLEGAYASIGDTLNAQIIHQVKFAQGESHVTLTDVETIKSRLASTEPDSFFLVVGYASTTGDASSNQTLSAKRATRSASVVNGLKAEGQNVRAVYLGQTTRFSTDNTAENQLCEIWKIN